MKLFAWLAAWVVVARDRVRSDRGDVPGWVMVTVITVRGIGR